MGCTLSGRVVPQRQNTRSMKHKAKKKIVVVRVNPVLFESVPRRNASLPIPVPLPRPQEKKLQALHLYGLEGMQVQYWNQHLLKMENRRSFSKSPLLTHTSK